MPHNRTCGAPLPALFDPARTQLFSFETRGSVVGEEAHGRVVATQPRPAVVGLRGQHLRHLDRVRAFPLIAVQVLHSTAFAVSLLEAAGLTVAALAAVALAPWVERRAKRPVMVAADLTRSSRRRACPSRTPLVVLTYGQLLIVSSRRVQPASSSPPPPGPT